MRQGDKLLKTHELALVVLLLVLMISTVWRILDQSHENAIITSFESCVAAGNPVRESYPEQCSVNGTVFTNPNQLLTQESQY